MAHGPTTRESDSRRAPARDVGNESLGDAGRCAAAAAAYAAAAGAGTAAVGAWRAAGGVPPAIPQLSLNKSPINSATTITNPH